MVDDGEADDKIIAVLEKDNVWGDVRDIQELPQIMIERLRHYFSTYKMKPGQEVATVIEWVYGREQALKVIEAAMEDYDEAFGQ
jgi:inorganic pyrophosphatase